MSNETMTRKVNQIERDKERWKVDHSGAMDCRDLEDLIERGIGHFWFIRLADDAWSRRVQDGEEEFDAEVARAYRADYEWWLEPCKSVLNRLDQLQRDFKVDRADQFRDCVLTAKRLVSFPIEDVIESYDPANAGRTVPFPPDANEVPEVGGSDAAR